MKCLDKKRIKMKQGETLALNERIMLSLVSTGVSQAGRPATRAASGPGTLGSLCSPPLRPSALPPRTAHSSSACHTHSTRRTSSASSSIS